MRLSVYDSGRTNGGNGRDDRARSRTARAAMLTGLVLSLAMLPIGCGRPDGRVAVYPVRGKVRMSGSVPEGALVVLYPAKGATTQELRPSGKVKPDGSFSLTTYDADDGAPTGEYTATIEWNKLIKRGQDYVAGPNVVPPEYAKPETSGWKIKVAEAPADLEPLDITAKK